MIAIGAEQVVEVQQRQIAYVMQVQEEEECLLTVVSIGPGSLWCEESCRLGAVLPLVMASSNAALDPAGVGAPGFGVLGQCRGDWGR